MFQISYILKKIQHIHLNFNTLSASCPNIVLVQKNITELAVEFKRFNEKIQTTIPNALNSLLLATNGAAIAGGKKLSRKKQTTTIKQDLALLIS